MVSRKQEDTALKRITIGVAIAVIPAALIGLISSLFILFSKISALEGMMRGLSHGSF